MSAFPPTVHLLLQHINSQPEKKNVEVKEVCWWLKY